nr:MAG TPA: hypothetical protein [Bacteriophage sp.]
MVSSVPFGIVKPNRSYLFLTYLVTAFCCAFDTATYFLPSWGPQI